MTGFWKTAIIVAVLELESYGSIGSFKYTTPEDFEVYICKNSASANNKDIAVEKLELLACTLEADSQLWIVLQSMEFVHHLSIMLAIYYIYSYVCVILGIHIIICLCIINL